MNPRVKNLRKRMKMRMKPIPVLVAVFSWGALSFAGTTAVINGTIVPVTSGMIPGGILLMEDETIVAMGPDVAIPEGAEVIDAEGWFVYPGMIDAFGSLGLYEIGSVPATVDDTEMGTYNPHIRASVAINPHSVHIPITRMNGITSQLVAPDGGVISGQCALIHLNGWSHEEMIVKDPAAIRVEFPMMPNDRSRRRGREQPREKATAERTERQIDGLREVFADARRYAEAREAYDRSKEGFPPDRDPVLEALIPVIEKKLPLILSVDWEADIENAVAFVDSMDVLAIFQGVSEGWKTASLLAEHDIPVIVGPVLRSPGERDPYDARYANAGILSRAGVKIAFYVGSAADARSLPYQAGFSAAFGLPKEEALKAVTIYPAEMLGIDDRLGSLEAGKQADVIVTDGDPLEMRTEVKHLFIAGEKVDLTSKHRALFEKFMNRPKPKE